MYFSLSFASKTETSCDDGLAADPPKVLKVYNRSLLFECTSRADVEALEGLLEYLQSQEKRLTDEEFRGSTQPSLSDFRVRPLSLLVLAGRIRREKVEPRRGLCPPSARHKQSFLSETRLFLSLTRSREK